MPCREMIRVMRIITVKEYDWKRDRLEVRIRGFCCHGKLWKSVSVS